MPCHFVGSPKKGRRLRVLSKLAALHGASDPYSDTLDDYLRDCQDEIDHLHSKAWQRCHGIPTK